MIAFPGSSVSGMIAFSGGSVSGMIAFSGIFYSILRKEFPGK
jgi:hypothetical protein